VNVLIVIAITRAMSEQRYAKLRQSPRETQCREKATAPIRSS